MNPNAVVTNVIINTQFPAIHNWPGCDVEGVEYLRHPHRHVFYVNIKIPVNHDDRDIEFIQFKSQVDNHVKEHYYNKDLKATSCEMLCEAFMKKWPEITYIRVMEDNENGAEKIRGIRGSKNA